MVEHRRASSGRAGEDTVKSAATKGVRATRWPTRTHGAIVLAAVGAILVLSLIFLYRTATERATPVGVSGQVPQTGHFLPAKPENFDPASVVMIDPNGRRIGLADYRGRILLINLWATWCRPCVQELPSLERLQSEFRGTDLAVVALSLDRDGWQTIAPFLAANGIDDLTVLADPDRTAVAAFGTDVLPSTYLVDREGRPTTRLVGEADWSAAKLRREIESTLSHCEACPPGNPSPNELSDHDHPLDTGSNILP